jgi:hypothetical protein
MPAGPRQPGVLPGAMGSPSFHVEGGAMKQGEAPE